MQDIEDSGQIEDTIALVKILALVNRQIEAGQVELVCEEGAAKRPHPARAA